MHDWALIRGRSNWLIGAYLLVLAGFLLFAVERGWVSQEDGE